MDASVIETVAKYFYFTSLSEQMTFACSFRVLGELKAQGWMEPGHRDRWVKVLSKWRLKMHKVGPRAWTHLPNERAFTIPDRFNMPAWQNFVENGDPGEVEAVLLSRILGFSDDEIADGLDVTRGTVRYRVGRGLRHLGGYLES